jgi:hypothetical protein
MPTVLMPWCLLLRRPLERQLANMECNAGSAVQITHHFLAQMVSERVLGPTSLFEGCRSRCSHRL